MKINLSTVNILPLKKLLKKILGEKKKKKGES